MTIIINNTAPRPQITFYSHTKFVAGQDEGTPGFAFNIDGTPVFIDEHDAGRLADYILRKISGATE